MAHVCHLQTALEEWKRAARVALQSEEEAMEHERQASGDLTARLQLPAGRVSAPEFKPSSQGPSQDQEGQTK